MPNVDVVFQNVVPACTHHLKPHVGTIGEGLSLTLHPSDGFEISITIKSVRQDFSIHGTLEFETASTGITHVSRRSVRHYQEASVCQQVRPQGTSSIFVSILPQKFRCASIASTELPKSSEPKCFVACIAEHGMIQIRTHALVIRQYEGREWGCQRDDSRW